MKNEAAWKSIPVCSYWTPYDLAILPVASCRWRTGETRRILCPLHPFMVRDKTVIADMIERTISIAPAK